jgi:hypothetical protein
MRLGLSDSALHQDRQSAHGRAIIWLSQALYLHIALAFWGMLL